MKSYLVLLGFLYMVSLPRESYSILLCDSDCRNSPLEICQDNPKTKTLLSVMALFPCNVAGFRARGLTVAAQMAVQKIASGNLLSGYILKLQVDNTMCDQLAAIRAFINQLSLVQGEQDQRYMIIGPGCSVGAFTTAEVAPFYSLTQIGYTTTSISLSNKRRFPNFLRSISSDNASIATVTALFREFEWKQVALVSVRDDLFSDLTSMQSAVLAQEGVRVLPFPYENGRTPNETFLRLENIVDRLNTSGARIILLNIYEDAARQIFCLAYKRGMMYPRYTFISQYWWSEFWWTDPSGSNCSVQELTNAIFMSLAIDHFPTPSEEEMNAQTDVGYDSPGAFWADFERNLKNLSYPRSEALRQAAFVYDAVWMAAIALNTTSAQLQNGTVLGANRLEQFNHFLNSTVTRDINKLILKAAQESNFRGVSGKVKLINGSREPTRKVYQLLYTQVVDPNIDANNDTAFALVDGTGSLTFLANHRIQTVFPDGVTVDSELVTITQVLFILYTIIACMGIIFAIGCMIFNIVFRKKRIVKLSSPYLNLLMISGAILYYVVVIMFGLDLDLVDFTTVDIVRCQVSVWLASIGFSLLFGTMLAKTWRVYYIFKNIRLKKRPLKDWLLFLIVMVMVGVDVVFLIIVSVDSFRVRLQQRDLIDRPNGQVPLLNYQCTSAASNIWIPILLVIKSLYLIVGVFLATQTYNVKLKRLRDSKLIVACVCSIVVVALVATTVGLSVDDSSVAYGVYGFCILSVVTVILFILFGTLMIELYQNPMGETDISTVGTTGNKYLDSTNQGNSEDQVKIDQLKQTIQSLKRDITDKKRQSENFLSPMHSDIHVSSKTNLLLDHVTPAHDQDNGHANEKTNGESVGEVANENCRELSPMNVEVENGKSVGEVANENFRELSPMNVENGKSVGEVANENFRELSPMNVENGKSVGEVANENCDLSPMNVEVEIKADTVDMPQTS